MAASTNTDTCAYIAIVQHAVEQFANKLDAFYLKIKQTSDATSHISTRQRRYLIPTGPFALDLHTSGDEINLVCLSDNTPKIFWSFVGERLGLEDDAKTFKAPADECLLLPASTINDLSNVYLRYCVIPPGFDPVTMADYGIPGYPESSRLSTYTMQNLELVQETWKVNNTLISISHFDGPSVFTAAYNRLRSWAFANGLLSKTFGMLDPDTLFWMLSNAFPLNEHGFAESNATRLCGAFFGLDIRGLISSSPSGLQRPTSFSYDGTWTVIKEVQKAYLVLHMGDDTNDGNERARAMGTLDEAMAVKPEQGWEQFLDKQEYFVAITAECWAPSVSKKSAFFDAVERRLASLTHDIRRDTDLKCWWRAWPYSKCLGNSRVWVFSQPMTNGGTATEPDTVPLASKDIVRFKAEVVERVSALSESSEGILDVQICSKALVQTLTAAHLETNKSTHDAPLPVQPSSTANNAEKANAKFRPASAVLSRLRWDPAHTAYEYEVGYIDRFEGLKWLDLEKWDKETEDEDFIPEHRIRVFRRKDFVGDEAVVWDRERRIDRT